MEKEMELKIENIEAFLSGDQFSNGLVVVIPKQKVSGRLERLKELAKGKSIIHFGYCDHLPLVKQKIQNGKWLHSIFNDVASQCIGLDIDLAAVAKIKTQFGIQNGFPFDLFQDELPEQVTDAKWDYVVMGEILEHVDNPVEFLCRMRTVFSPYVSKLIITVPNAYDFTSRRFFARNAECINSDHRYWFTPYTLAKVAFRAGIKLAELSMCDESMVHSRWRRYVVNRRPILAETIVATFEW